MDKWWCIMIMIIMINLLLVLIINLDNQTTYLRQSNVDTTIDICDRNYDVNEMIWIEKKITFYRIRQHHIRIDFNCETNSKFLDVLIGRNGYSKKIVFEYWSNINNINSSIFEKKANELPIYTKDVYNCGYTNNPIDIYSYRNDNIGYTIDNKFIQELALDIKGIPLNEINRQFLYLFERDLLGNAYFLHNTFYNKLKAEYKKIEEKYKYILDNFENLDTLKDELHIKEIEMGILEDFDYIRRKIELTEMKLLLKM